MSSLRVLDHSGHREVRWDPVAVEQGDAEALAAVHQAERLLAQACKAGGQAFRVDRDQVVTRLDEFDPNAEEIVVVARVIGG